MAEPVATYLDVPIYFNPESGQFSCNVNPEARRSVYAGGRNPNNITRNNLAALKREIAKRKASPEVADGQPIDAMVIHTGYANVGGWVRVAKLVSYQLRKGRYGRGQWRLADGALLDHGGNNITPADPRVKATVEAMTKEFHALRERWSAYVESLPQIEPDVNGRPRVTGGPSEPTPAE